MGDGRWQGRAGALQGTHVRRPGIPPRRSPPRCPRPASYLPPAAPARRRQVMEEGEALSRKQLAQEQAIKKLRVQAKELQAQVQPVLGCALLGPGRAESCSQPRTQPPLHPVLPALTYAHPPAPATELEPAAGSGGGAVQGGVCGLGARLHCGRAVRHPGAARR